MKSVALHNLGCKVNSYEIEVMQQMLQEKGYNIVSFDGVADIYIVNTCTVTNIADRKSRQMLHRAKAKNPDAVVVAVGCYVQTAGDALEKDACIDLAIGNNRKKELVEILESYLRERVGGAGYGREIIDINKSCEYEELRLERAAGHTRAYIKIQDGCNQFCSYCIIPFARGRVRSRRAEDILAEAAGLAEAGYREVVLTGIHISSYGIDFEDAAWGEGRSEELSGTEGQRGYGGSPKLLELIERLHDIEEIDRIRLGSLEPRIITPENARRLAALPKLCPHFHLSLQSGCDRTLKRMNRHYTTGEYYGCVELLRSAFDRPAITTDVIAGFPGETEEEFAETKAFLEKVRFYEMHVFKYSRRKGTGADGMPDQVPDEIKTLRSNELLKLERQQSESFRAGYIGEVMEVLFEEAKKIEGRVYQLGTTANYVKVALETEENLSNCMKKVKITGFLTEEILNSISFH